MMILPVVILPVVTLPVVILPVDFDCVLGHLPYRWSVYGGQLPHLIRQCPILAE